MAPTIFTPIPIHVIPGETPRSGVDIRDPGDPAKTPDGRPLY
jgi:hypothetical protein